MFVIFSQAYLEDFYAFCQETGGATADVMCEALAVSKTPFTYYLEINIFPKNVFFMSNCV